MTTASQNPDFFWKAHDTAPVIQAQLTDSSGAPVDVTGSTVKFIMKAQGSMSTKVNAAGTLVTPVSGLVQYQPISTDTDTAGDYQAEFEVIFASGKKQTFPDPGYLLVRVTADLDGA